MAMLSREVINQRRATLQDIDICAVAETLGFHVRQVGKNYFSLIEHDSVRIDIQKNIFFRNSNNAKGDVVEFLLEFGKEHSNPRFSSIDYCITWLEKNKHLPRKNGLNSTNYNPQNSSTYRKYDDSLSNKRLILPQRAEDNKRIFAYLTKTRRIHPSIVNMMIESQMLYQSKDKANCVFVGYDYFNKQPVYCVERGSNSKVKFYRELEGCNYDYGISFIGNSRSKLLFVTESFIDLMSIQSITGSVNENYLALNGVQKEQALYHFLDHHPQTSMVILALDNDPAGISATDHILGVLKKKYPQIGVRILRPNFTKDWNEELIYYATHNEKKTTFMKNDPFYSPQAVKKENQTLTKRTDTPMDKAKIEQLQRDALNKKSIPCDIPSRTIVLDCETTGLDSYEDEMLQLSVIDADNNVLLNTYLKPYTKTSWEDAQKVNHITYNMVKDAPYFHEIIPKLKGILDNCDTIIGYNTHFDLGFINMKLRDDIEIVDVMQDFAPIYGEWSEHYQNYKWQKLVKCAEYYGFDWNSIKENAHDSLGDCYATLHCYHSMQLDKKKEMSL